MSTNSVARGLLVSENNKRDPQGVVRRTTTSVATIRGRGRVVKREAKRGKARWREPRARRARRGHIKGESELTKRAANCRLNASSTTAADSTPKSWEKGGYGLILLGAPCRSSYTARSLASARCVGARSPGQTSSPTRDTSVSHLEKEGGWG